MSAPSPPPVHIAILGAGIVGLSTSLYLLRHPSLPLGSTVILVENTRQGRVAPGASSQGGGFIAGGDGQSWVNPRSRSLARCSFQCYKELDALLDGVREYGWRECGATGLRVGEGDEDRSKYRILPQGEAAPASEWLEGVQEQLGRGTGIGQVDPAMFCETVHRHISRNPAFRTVYGEPLALASADGLHNLLVQPHNSAAPLSLAVHHIVVCAGPWSAPLCAKLKLPIPPISNLPGHSLLIRPSLSAVKLSSPSLPIDAVFAGINGAQGGVHQDKPTALTAAEQDVAAFTPAPEFFVRANGLVYAAGENAITSQGHDGPLPHRLPPNVDDVKLLVDPHLIRRLENASAKVSKALDVTLGALTEVQQFCFRPITPDLDPIVDRLRSDGVWFAGGHGPWGITLAPGTGKVMAEMVLEGRARSADISELSLGRFRKEGAHL